MKGQYKFNKGNRKIGGRDIFCHSTYEANFCRYLQELKETGKIKDFYRNTTAYRFSKEVKVRGLVIKSYIPDFIIFLPNKQVEFYEVKGWENDKFKMQMKQFDKDWGSVISLTIFGKEWFKENLELLKGLKGYEVMKV